MGKISRRSFFRLGVLAATGYATGCDLHTPQPAATQPTPPSSPSLVRLEEDATAAPVRITLAGGDADVWAWQREVTGTLAGVCADAHLQVGDAKVDLTRDGERFTAQAPLKEGPNPITVVCRQPNGHEERSRVQTYTVPLTRRPTAVVTITIEGDQIVLDGSASLPDDVGQVEITTYHWSFRDTNPDELAVRDAAKEGNAVVGKRIFVSPPQADGEYVVVLRVVDAEGREDTGASYFAVDQGQPRIPDYTKENPAWIENAVIYGVVLRKFGDPAFGGVIDRLDYLQDLGVDALWLGPTNTSPVGDYGYAVIDYFDVNPNFGTTHDFRRLVEEAHARGIRVLMDFVPNHSSAEHPYFVDAQERGKESPYYTFYDRDESGNPTHYFDWEHLPNLNYNNPEVERFMLEAFSYWVREFDVDGFRVDAAWGVTERKPEFWPRWRRELKRIKPDLLLLAEASAREPYYFDNGYDAAYDWTAALGKWAWELVWDSKTLLTYNLNSALTNNQQGFHPDALIFRFLNNNDTGNRFITDHGEQMTRVATALLLTLPGLPCVYTGDEIGAWFRPYFDELPLTWNEDKYPGLRAYHKQLIKLRHDTPSLHSRQWQRLEIESEQQIYGYLRYVGENAEPVLVLLNFSDQNGEVEVPLPEAFAAFGTQGALREVLAGEPLAPAGTAPLKITMPAWGVKILKEV
jgi:glycosidase